MDSFDKKMKDAFEAYDEQIPEGMSWDEMAPGILDKMDVPKEKKRFTLLFVLIGIGFISLGAFMTYHFMHEEGNKNVGPYTTLPEQQITVSEQKLKSIEEKSTLETTDNTEELQSNTTTKTNNIVSIDVESHSSTAYSYPASKDQSGVAKIVHLEEQETTAMDKEELNQPHKVVEVNNYDKQSSHHVRGLFDHKRLSVQKTAFLNNQSGSQLAYPLVGKMLLKEPKDYNPPFLSKAFYIAFDAGLMFWDWNQTEDGTVSIDQYEREQLSYNVNGRIGWQLHKNWSLETGLQLKSFESEFNGVFYDEYKDRTDTLEQPIYNVVTRVVSYEQQGEIEVDVFEKRTIRHFNALVQLSVPVVASFQWNRKKWALSAGAGANISYMLLSKGRSINAQEQLVEYNANTTLRSFAGFDLVGRFGLDYKLNDSYALYTDIRVNQALNTWTIDSEMSRNPLHYTINLGVKKRFAL